jgi:hypothetical protein
VRGQGMEAGPLPILHYIQNKSYILFATLCNNINQANLALCSYVACYILSLAI